MWRATSSETAATEESYLHQRIYTNERSRYNNFNTYSTDFDLGIAGDTKN
jgi:hypothetical protein